MWPPACLDLTPEAQHWGPPSGSPASLPLSPAGWSAHNLLACPRNCLGSSVQGESFSFSFRGFCLCFTLVCSPLQLIFLWVSRPPTQKWFRPLPPPLSPLGTNAISCSSISWIWTSQGTSRILSPFTPERLVVGIFPLQMGKRKTLCKTRGRTSTRIQESNTSRQCYLLCVLISMNFFKKPYCPLCWSVSLSYAECPYLPSQIPSYSVPSSIILTTFSLLLILW